MGERHENRLSQGRKNEPPAENWYDHPGYYDAAFSESETGEEVRFYLAAFREFAKRPIVRVLEAACGSGRLLARLAKNGFVVTGFDLNSHMVAYAQRRLRRMGFDYRIDAANMTSFSSENIQDAILCSVSSFRHLLTEEDAASFFRQVAKSLAPGGLFILSLHLLPLDADEEDSERWRVVRGKKQYSWTLQVLECHRRKRLEKIRVSVRETHKGKTKRMASEFLLRLYSPAQFKRFLSNQSDFELVGTFDYLWDINAPIPITRASSDVVVVLRKSNPKVH